AGEAWSLPADHGLRRREDGGDRKAGSAEHPVDPGGLATVRSEARAGGVDVRRRRHLWGFSVGRSARGAAPGAAGGDSPQHRGGRVRSRRARRPLRVKTPVRIGAVGYLNARPLTWALDADPRRWAIRYDLPSVCSSLLHAGQVDLGLVPSIDYLQDPGYRFVPGVGIGSRGPVASVAMYTRVPVERIRSIALDTSSRTSVTLIRVLCRHRFGVAPEFVAHGP